MPDPEQEAARVKKLARTVHRSVWNEYFAWEKTACTRVLQCLRKDPFARHENATHVGEEETVLISPDETSHLLPQSDFMPTDPYESCLPAYRQILHGDDPNDMPFVPYADDPTFKFADYATEHSRFAWKTRESKTDEKWICLETARRLFCTCGIGLRDIDVSMALPYKILPSSRGNQDGLLWWAKQNDCPDWPPLRGLHTLFTQEMLETEAGDWTQRFKDCLCLFCSNPNCVQAQCWSHENENHHLERDPRYIVPLHSAEREVPSKPCQNECYLNNLEAIEGPLDNDIDYNVIHDLFLTFSLSPNAAPCDIAAITRVPPDGQIIPCSQVHQLRVAWSNTLDSPSEATAMILAKSNTRPRFASGKADQTVHFRSCSHEGPCNSISGCTCHKNRRPCERTCCCTKNCYRRWKGCACANKKKIHKKACLVKHQCACREAGRECDPELCNCCRQNWSTDSVIECRNTQIQRQDSKHLRVQRSLWGFGVILCQDVRRNDLICEYTGELIYDDTLYSRDYLAQHRKRFYAYQLNADFNTDASCAGNESRFINHAPEHQANCEVRFPIVNGEHRIGVYAKTSITAGTELFIDYGPEARLNTRTAI